MAGIFAEVGEARQQKKWRQQGKNRLSCADARAAPASFSRWTSRAAC